MLLLRYAFPLLHIQLFNSLLQLASLLMQMMDLVALLQVHDELLLNVYFLTDLAKQLICLLMLLRVLRCYLSFVELIDNRVAAKSRVTLVQHYLRLPTNVVQLTMPSSLAYRTLQILTAAVVIR